MQEAKSLLNQRRVKASDLLQRIKNLHHVHGIEKLQKRTIAENKFLLSLEDVLTETALENHLKSSNLSYLEAVLTIIEYSKSVKNVLKKFTYSSEENRTSDIIVDVVGYDGKLWLKALARNPYALHQIWKGAGQYGAKDVCKLAWEYQIAAKQNCVDFMIPKIAFLFASGITKSVAKDLEDMNIKVIGKRVDDPDELEKVTLVDPFDSSEWYATADLLSLHFDDLEQTKVNLDITALVALVSSITNDNDNFEFEDEILNTQGEQERLEPLLPILNSFLQGKVLYVCNTALTSFQKIVATIGGEKEKERADELLKKVTVVDDSPSVKALHLPKSAHIKDRSKIIFGTGDSLQATTLTANQSFVRAAHDQGADFSVFLHSSRALAERKIKGKKMPQSI